MKMIMMAAVMMVGIAAHAEEDYTPKQKQQIYARMCGSRDEFLKTFKGEFTGADYAEMVQQRRGIVDILLNGRNALKKYDNLNIAMTCAMIVSVQDHIKERGCYYEIDGDIAVAWDVMGIADCKKVLGHLNK